ncbi:MAG: hypothetical protein Q7S36_00170 [Candidatus Liptonbacteria bacterium]|nr:hypothetical protein [Candidatus Liptonbacteria bacterium]
MIGTEYLNFLKQFARIKKPLRVVCDASDGSTGPFLKKLRIPKTAIKVLNARPDGNFPAHGPNPMKPGSEKELSREVKKFRADFGAIFDGDGDRAFFLDETGARIPPDAVSFLISKNFRPPYVTTENSGYLFRLGLPASKMKVSKAGHYFIKKTMRRLKAKFAAEISGHYHFEHIFGGRRAYYDSALRALVEFAGVVSELKEKGLTLSGWLKLISPPFATGELNFSIQGGSASGGKVKDAEAILRRIKKTYSKNKISELDGISIGARDFWLNIRSSNTEPLLRLNLESKNKKVFSREFRRLKKLIYS